MAFNFNWSPLAADAEFYKRAQELLTSALNKYPKPPIIVDDILVTEFNLGSVPPDLEILEIGDLAEDRFRGIFKMCYSGDAFLTLRTRVQANPLNTYLSAKPSFTSPKPLAASAGLTIPLSITLSEIKLSAFIILVFSKQKGLTLVFRNDPLESLKVSSTFDSIQFVRDYLQRTIEGQLRNLMMDELPAIIHKLSLRLWCPDQMPRDEEIVKENVENEAVVDPFANPPVEAVDSHGHVLDANDIASLSLDGGPGAQSLFSQKNMLRLAALTDSHRTLSLFTPGIRNAMFRAWAGPTERHDTGASTPIAAPALYRMPSTQGSSTIYTFTDTSSIDQGSLPSRPSLVSLNSTGNGLALGAGKHSRNLRKKKTRVVNLRRPKPGSETSSDMSSDMGDMVSDTVSITVPISEPILPTSIPEEVEHEEETAVPQVPNRVRCAGEKRPTLIRPPLDMGIYEEPVVTDRALPTLTTGDDKLSSVYMERAREMVASSGIPGFDKSKPLSSDTSSVILEQAWIMKMADEIARRVYDENQRNEKLWEERDDAPPPAYQPTYQSVQ
ncbi:mitochondrial distribution and morphology protein 34 [Xylaria telfairii]|nr:mitochondrial distribution and morphology protein 34 [Xylaria telfairii]